MYRQKRRKNEKKIFILCNVFVIALCYTIELIKKCKLILADEPTGSLDNKNAGIVMNILKELNVSGKIIVLVTHDKAIKKIGNQIIYR